MHTITADLVIGWASGRVGGLVAPPLEDLASRSLSLVACRRHVEKLGNSHCTGSNRNGELTNKDQLEKANVVGSIVAQNSKVAV